jgi:hypothetical protein
MPVKTVAPDWPENEQIIAGIEPTSRQLDLFIRDQSRQFGEVDFDYFAHKKEIGQQ